MDIIAGLVTVSSSFMLSAAIAGLLVWWSARGRAASASEEPVRVGTGPVLAVMVVVYFVATTQLLLIAQQHGLALGNFIVGIVVVAILFVEPAVRGRGQSREDDGNWRK